MGKTIDFNLYQAKTTCPYAFRGYEHMMDATNGRIDPNDYEKVHESSIHTERNVKDMTLLEKLFIRFNGDNRPGRTEFRSMSVSDVMGLTDENGTRFYYCDTYGFRPVEFHPENTKETFHVKGLYEDGTEVDIEYQDTFTYGQLAESIKGMYSKKIENGEPHDVCVHADENAPGRTAGRCRIYFDPKEPCKPAYEEHGDLADTPIKEAVASMRKEGSVIYVDITVSIRATDDGTTDGRPPEKE